MLGVKCKLKRRRHFTYVKFNCTMTKVSVHGRSTPSAWYFIVHTVLTMHTVWCFSLYQCYIGVWYEQINKLHIKSLSFSNCSVIGCSLFVGGSYPAPLEIRNARRSDKGMAISTCYLFTHNVYADDVMHLIIIWYIITYFTFLHPPLHWYIVMGSQFYHGFTEIGYLLFSH